MTMHTFKEYHFRVLAKSDTNPKKLCITLLPLSYCGNYCCKFKTYWDWLVYGISRDLFVVAIQSFISGFVLTLQNFNSEFELPVNA